MRHPRGLRGRCMAAAALVLVAGGVHAADTARITPPAPEARVHVVARGDTLSGIAVRYGVSVAALVTANRLPSERATLKVGQRLTVPPATAAPAAPRRPSSALALATPRPDMIREPRYGRVVKIEHDGGFVTVYAHNEENLVEAGTRVGAGDPIATIGRTGRATAHHLHFEIRRDGSVYNPLYLLPLPPRISQVEESDETEEEHD